MNKDILLQIAINFFKELLEFFDNSEVRTLSEIEAELSRIMKAFVRELIKAYIQIADEAILKDKSSRKERGLA